MVAGKVQAEILSYMREEGNLCCLTISDGSVANIQVLLVSPFPSVPLHTVIGEGCKSVIEKSEIMFKGLSLRAHLWSQHSAKGVVALPLMLTEKAPL